MSWSSIRLSMRSELIRVSEPNGLNTIDVMFERRKGMTRSLLVGYDHTDGKDNTVLVVGERLPGAKATTIINAFQGVEAKWLYEKLTTKVEKGEKK